MTFTRTCHPPRGLLFLVACALLLAASTLHAAESARRGESVQAVIERLADSGLQVVYNTTLVPASLAVAGDYQEQRPERLLEKILSPYGLALQAVKQGLYVIVPVPDSDSSRLGSLLVMVSSAVSGKPLAEVELWSDQDKLLGTTGPGGSLLLHEIPAGPIRIIARNPGHQQASERAEILGGHTAVVSLAMDFLPQDLQRLVVTASRYSLQRVDPANTSYVGRLEMESSPRLGGETLRTTHRLPGNASTGLSSLAHVRGGDLDETLILFEGLRLYQPFHLKDYYGPFSIIDSHAVESLEFYSGGFTVEYADRMSAVIDMHALQPADTRYWQATLGTFHTSALTAGMSDDGKTEWLASARRSNLEFLSGLMEHDIGEPNYVDAYARLQRQLSDNASLTLNALFASDNVSLHNTDQTQRSAADYRNSYLWGSLQQDLGPRLQQVLRISLTSLNSERAGQVEEPGDRQGSVLDDREFKIGSLGLDWHYSYSPGLMLRFGVEAKHTDGNYRYLSQVDFDPLPVPGLDPPDRQFDTQLQADGNQYAAYLTGRLQPLDRLTVEAGLRWDSQSYTATDQQQISPRLNLMYQLAAGTLLRAAWGRYYQADAVDELRVEDGITDFFPPQEAEHMILGLEHAFANTVQLRMELFRKNFDTLRPHAENLFDPVQLIPELGRDRVLLEPRSGRAQGLELMLARKRDQGWSYWANYSWAQAWDNFGDAREERSWDQPHTINLGVAWRSGPWIVDAAASWHSGWPTTALSLQSNPEGSQALVVGTRNSERFAHFSSIDLHLSRDFRIGKGRLRTFLEITNLFNTENPCCADYQLGASPGGGYTLSREEDYWLRLVPSLGVTWFSR